MSAKTLAAPFLLLLLAACGTSSSPRGEAVGGGTSDTGADGSGSTGTGDAFDGSADGGPDPDGGVDTTADGTDGGVISIVEACDNGFDDDGDGVVEYL